MNFYINIHHYKTQVASVGEKKICLLPSVEKKKPYIYKIPKSLKNEDKKILESKSEIAYPVVCVAKKDGSMHLCIDSV